LFGEIGIGIAGDQVKHCSGCSADDFQFGFELNQHYNSGGAIDPWIGGGLGIEVMTVKVPVDYYSFYNEYYSYNYTAIPELTVQGGLDFGGENFGIGPYLSAGVGAYTSGNRSYSCDGCDSSDEGSFSLDPSVHVWLQLGVHVAYLR
jgi:hypothetical protein